MEGKFLINHPSVAQHMLLHKAYKVRDPIPTAWGYCAMDAAVSKKMKVKKMANSVALLAHKCKINLVFN